MREVVEQLRAEMDVRGVDALGYCTGGHGHGMIPVEEIERNEQGEYADAHGACPGPVIVIERDPDAVVEEVPGGVQREAPPCGRCGTTTNLRFRPLEAALGGPDVVLGPEQRTDEHDEEWSFRLQAVGAGARLEGEPMDVCLRCLAGALNAPAPFALLAVRGRTVPWRS